MKSRRVTHIFFIQSIAFLFAFILVGRLFVIQIVHGEAYVDLADRQYVRRGNNVFDRGTIYFKQKDGNLVSAATLQVGYTLAIDPRRLENPVEAYAKLNEIVPIDKEIFLHRAAKKDDPYEEIAHRLDREAVEAIDALGINGVIISKEKWRYYPAGKLASHVIGFVGYDHNVLGGRYGIERHYDDVLTRNNKPVRVNFFAEIFANIKDTLSSLEGGNRDGDVVLTIEPTVQMYLESVLSEVTERWSTDEAGGIIMNPQTGAIYAMAALPNFNPNAFNEVKDLRVFSNPLVENMYEMGSIIKPLTMAAGIDSGAITPESTYEDTGTIILNGRRISNYDGRARGVVPMQEVLSQSLNTGAAYIALKMGKERFRDYMHAFGMGELTRIELPNEESGLVQNLESTRDVEYATASFGQGIALTPIATIRALATLANGGYLVKPHVVDRIEYDVGFPTITTPKKVRKVLSEKTSTEVTNMLVRVVDTALKHGAVKSEYYSIAAKTGTAQIPSPEGGYYDDRYFHSFFGYFPASAPRFIVFLYVKEPKGAWYASQTLTDPFMDITKFLLQYYDVPPDRSPL